jgi:hypothetical protein
MFIVRAENPMGVQQGTSSITGSDSHEWNARRTHFFRQILRTRRPRWGVTALSNRASRDSGFQSARRRHAPWPVRMSLDLMPGSRNATGGIPSEVHVAGFVVVQILIIGNVTVLADRQRSLTDHHATVDVDCVHYLRTTTAAAEQSRRDVSLLLCIRPLRKINLQIRNSNGASVDSTSVEEAYFTPS